MIEKNENQRETDLIELLLKHADILKAETNIKQDALNETRLRYNTVISIIRTLKEGRKLRKKQQCDLDKIIKRHSCI